MCVYVLQAQRNELHALSLVAMAPDSESHEFTCVWHVMRDEFIIFDIDRDDASHLYTIIECYLTFGLFGCMFFMIPRTLLTTILVYIIGPVVIALANVRSTPPLGNKLRARESKLYKY